MQLDKTHQYVFRMGSDVQHRLFWDGKTWSYEFLAGGVVFDQQKFGSEEEIEGSISVHGLSLDRFQVDHAKSGALYSEEIQKRLEELTKKGIQPCPKHGLISKNLDNTCEACENSDYPDDFKGTEG